MTMDNEKFIGRTAELAEFNALLKKKTASFVVVKGRRRVGKSRLIDHFAKKFHYYKFTGLAPSKGVTAQDQRNEFLRRLSELTNLPEIQLDDWIKLFKLVAEVVKKDRVILCFDEISWMAAGDDTFLSKLKNAWEDYFKNNNQLIFIVCSSVSIWVEENILSSTAFLGRIAWTVNLDPLPLQDCNKMLELQGFKSSNYEKFKILSVTGGIPWYLEQIQGQYTAEENIKRQCFTSGGVMTNDFARIFNDLFDKRSQLYKNITEILVNGVATYGEIAEQLQYEKSARLSDYISNLIEAGFIIKDYTWSLSTEKALDLFHYRLSDNYLRFYLKYIEPRISQITAKRLSKINLSAMPGWETIMGLQFENLVVNNRHEIYRLLNLRAEDIVYDNPFFQNKTSRQKGCQIDFLIQTKFKIIYALEIKFSKNVLGSQVIDEVGEKINRISLPRHMTVLPVLIHVNGVSAAVTEADYFYAIIDFGEFL